MVDACTVHRRINRNPKEKWHREGAREELREKERESVCVGVSERGSERERKDVERRR